HLPGPFALHVHKTGPDSTEPGPKPEIFSSLLVQDAGRGSAAPRPAKRLSGQPYTLPEDAVEWIEALAVLRREAVTNPKVVPFRGITVT
ncbi:hypothetical protein, partial [Streptomyces sp. NPDC055085]